MKFYKKYFSLRHWLAFLRRQPSHMQHMYAVAFSATITAMIGAGILYFDYGFWHERYSRSETVATTTIKNVAVQDETVSPGEMMGDFFKEASVRIQSLKDQKVDLLEGKEVYINENIGTTTDIR